MTDSRTSVSALGLATGPRVFYGAEMRTLGVDLAAQPKTTFAAVIDWSGSHPVLDKLIDKLDIDAVVSLVRQADAAGIDCPFGWPAPFVKVLQASGKRTDPGLLESVDDRKPLSYRTTDLAVLQRTNRKIRPLSVSTNFLGATAMRCTGLLWAIGGTGFDRTGASGDVFEVYPAASLWCWTAERDGKPPWTRYKKDRDARDAIAQWIIEETGLTGLAGAAETDHGLDAVLAALTARAAKLGRTTPAPAAQDVDTEGWIHLPKSGIRLRDAVC